MKTKIKTIKTNRKSVQKWIVVISAVFVLLSYCQIAVAVAADITAQEMIELTNKSREESGLLPLKINDKLIVAAEAKVNDMFKFQYFDHNSPSGVTPWHWIKSAGYNYRYAGENLAIDFVTAEGTHLALMRSITHRDNILKPNYTEIGVAVKKGIFDGNESIIIVEEFGAPLEKKKKEIKIDIKGDADINLKESKTENKMEEMEIKEIEIKEIKEIKEELVEIKSPIVYFRDENYEINEIKEEEEIIIEKTNKEFVLPIMFPVENVKPLDKNLTENIFWNNHKEEDRGIFGEIISLFNYKFLFIKMDLFAK